MQYNSDDCVYVTLRRKDNGQPWGFRMIGGQDQGCCLHIAKVNPKSVAARCGLGAGDTVLRIGEVPANYLSHNSAKAEILRAGNELHILVKRNAVQVGEDVVDGGSAGGGGRSEVVEEQSQYRGVRNSTIQSRSFRIITESLVEEMNSFPGIVEDATTANATNFAN